MGTSVLTVLSKAYLTGKLIYQESLGHLPGMEESRHSGYIFRGLSGPPGIFSVWVLVRLLIHGVI